MTKRKMSDLSKNLFVLLVLCLGLLYVKASSAGDIHQLYRSGDVTMTAWVGKKPPQNKRETPTFSVQEQVILTIEVGTPRWFTGGTRIGSVEITNVIAKQRNQFATNFTERVDGVTWSRQRWEVTLYPQASGEFGIPPIAVGLNVSGPDGKKVQGTLYTEALKFKTQLPSGLLTNDGNWFSATDVKVEQSWSASNESLRVGDAITRTISITASDSLSVLLPDLLRSSQNQFVTAYPQPDKLTDTQERGNYRSSRVEESVYVIQQGGEIRFPEYKVEWWNPKAEKVESYIVEGQSYKASHTLGSFVSAYTSQLIIAVVCIVALITFAVGIKRHYRSKPLPEGYQYWKLVRANRFPEAKAMLYKKLRINHGLLELSKFSRDPDWQKNQSDIQKSVNSHNLLINLWRQLSKRASVLGKVRIPKALPSLEKRKEQ
ncbi:BatD family protein [Vibrio maerlii]|uniref:BatD family protein n=1 Tax=Vibrio maerlii TaxID=2231648 RepID=UPI000E3C4D5B|nr:BatD family protein [Vibrio maerlii]